MLSKKMTLSSWGNHQQSLCEVFRPEKLEDLLEENILNNGIIAQANRLNYGDQAFNTGGDVIQMTRLDRMLSFDEKAGVLVCEPGVTFHDILTTFLPKGWMPPAIPGTLNVSMGGAIANDVHGKNDVHYGSFGQHVLAIELLTPAGLQTITPHKNTDLFWATIGGLGLTGIITRLSLQLLPAASDMLMVKTQRIDNIEQWIDAFSENRVKNHDFCVGWIDLSSRGVHSGRGLLWTADFYTEGKHKKPRDYLFTMPPLPLFQPQLLDWFNQGQFRFANDKPVVKHIMDFLSPLDSIKHWNRGYGKAGFYQLQCLLPFDTALSGYREILAFMTQQKIYAALSIIKPLFKTGQGLLSFPGPGVTLAMDFHNKPRHQQAIGDIMAIVQAHNGKIYLAKDSLLDVATFRAMYPEQDAFRTLRKHAALDTAFCSDLSRRLEI